MNPLENEKSIYNQQDKQLIDLNIATFLYLFHYYNKMSRFPILIVAVHISNGMLLTIYFMSFQLVFFNAKMAIVSTIGMHYVTQLTTVETIATKQSLAVCR